MKDMNETGEQEDIKEEFGIVAMIDALGVSNYNGEESINFLNIFKSIISQNKKIYEYLESQEKTYFDSNAMENVKISKFGDSIIWAWPIEDKNSIVNLIIVHSVAIGLNDIMLRGLFNKIPLRGVISVGKYVWDKEDERLIGRAISEATNWYNTVDWLGIIFTPNADLWLSQQIERNESDIEKAAILNAINTFICKYQVPLKDNHNTQNNFEKLFVVGWPVIFHNTKIYDKDKSIAPLSAQQIFYKLLFDIPKSEGTESKYENTKKFFEWYENEQNNRT
jgi:hypothetical protein